MGYKDREGFEEVKEGNWEGDGITVYALEGSANVRFENIVCLRKGTAFTNRGTSTSWFPCWGIKLGCEVENVYGCTPTYPSVFKNDFELLKTKSRLQRYSEAHRAQMCGLLEYAYGDTKERGTLISCYDLSENNSIGGSWFCRPWGTKEWLTPTIDLLPKEWDLK